MKQSTTQPVYLVIGAGSREHAMAWALSLEEGARVHVAPGNDGIRRDSSITGRCHDVAVDDLNGLVELARRLDATLTIVGPELPLTLGVVDRFMDAGLPIWGPSQAASQLEGSKAFAKDVMDRAGVPTASWAQFDVLEDALSHVRDMAHPVVIKADGLAGGKGVVISESLEHSQTTLREMMVAARFGEASRRVIVESFLRGTELSFMVATDGTRIFPLMTSQDHKRLLDGDEGPNTGGMGAFTPSPLATDALREAVLTQVIAPVLQTMRDDGAPFVGFLYAGLMCHDDQFQVLEFNARLGDPETQALLYALSPDAFGQTLLAILNGASVSEDVFATTRHGFAVVLASAGYPGKIEPAQLNVPIDGVDDVPAGSVVFHAASAWRGERWINRGGRVMSVVSRGSSAQEARRAAYEAARVIHWDGMHYRLDMGRFHME